MFNRMSNTMSNSKSCSLRLIITEVLKKGRFRKTPHITNYIFNQCCLFKKIWLFHTRFITLSKNARLNMTKRAHSYPYIRVEKK